MDNRIVTNRINCQFISTHHRIQPSFGREMAVLLLLLALALVTSCGSDWYAIQMGKVNYYSPREKRHSLITKQNTRTYLIGVCQLLTQRWRTAFPSRQSQSVSTEFLAFLSGWKGKETLIRTHEQTTLSMTFCVPINA